MKPVASFHYDELLLALSAATDPDVLAAVVADIGRRPRPLAADTLVTLLRTVLTSGFVEYRTQAWPRPGNTRLVAYTIDTCANLRLRECLVEIGEYLSKRFADEIRTTAAYALSQMPDRKYTAIVDTYLADPGLSTTLRERLEDARCAIAALPEAP